MAEHGSLELKLPNSKKKFPIRLGRGLIVDFRASLVVFLSILVVSRRSCMHCGLSADFRNKKTLPEFSSRFHAAIP